MKELARLLLEYVLAVFIPIVSAFLIKWINQKAEREKTEANRDSLYEYVDFVEQIIVQAVSHTSQVFVDSLKKQGVFTKEKQVEAFDKAKKEVLSLVPESVLSLMRDYFGDFDAWLDSKIEQVVHSLKN